MRAGTWLFAIVLMTACARAIPKLPSRGGPAWVEVKSPHVTLWTNGSAERGHEIVREVERRRQIVMDAMNHARSNVRVFVIALADLQQVQAYTGVGFGGFAWSANNATAEPGLLMEANAREFAQTVTHELTHVIAFGMIRHQPRWLSEGIASYFENADLDGDRGSVQIGVPRSGFRWYLRGGHLRSVEDLFGCKGRCVDQAYYATGWALFSYLVNEHFERLGRYLQRLNELPADKHVQAWNEVFPDLPPATLDHKLYRWVKIGDIRLPRVPVTVRDVPTSQRALGDADVLVARAVLEGTHREDLTKLSADEAASVRTDLDAALAIDRTHLLANLSKAELTRSIAPDDARAVAAAHPDDWRAWRLVERALHGSPEGDAAHAKLCALADDAAPECSPAAR